MSDLYQCIKGLCDAKGIKPSRMCTDIGLSKSTMSGLKTGRKIGMTVDTAQSIANYFGVSIDEVIGNKSTKSVAAASTKVDNDRTKTVESILKYLELNSENREAVTRIIDQLLKAQSIG